jgi:hypothetical protein
MAAIAVGVINEYEPEVSCYAGMMEARKGWDIKSVIAVLCKHLKLSFNVNVKPEHFRLSKFNKTEDNCVRLFLEFIWELLS